MLFVVTVRYCCAMVSTVSACRGVTCLAWCKVTMEGAKVRRLQVAYRVGS